MKITKDKKSLRRIWRLVEATIILHNMLLTCNENMEMKAWIDEDDISACDAEGR